MSFSADIFHDRYPIREAGATAYSKQYWVSQHRKNLSHLQELCAQGEQGQTGQVTNEQGSSVSTIDADGEIKLSALAKFFGDYRHALKDVHGLDLSQHHITAAYGLFERRVEVLRTDSDRVLVAGLAASAFVQSGVSVHLIGDATYEKLVLEKLVPMLDYLEISFGKVTVGDDERTRHQNYSCDITLVSARECAMDFLRDSVNWPKRGNRAHRVVDRLVGRRAKHKMRIMNGLPCAIHLDAQSALIDKARAPIVLTQDAHPMHEVEELQRALELAQSMQLAKDFIYSGKELEIAYTQEGKVKIEAWANEHGGIWLVPSAADLMIAIALVVQNIIHLDQHYRITNDLLEWIVPDQLVPGMRYYSKPFLTRAVELANQCSMTGMQEVVGRASYQHVFNRYIHLCGLSHAAGLASEEFTEVYGLTTAKTTKGALAIDRTTILIDDAAKIEYIKAMLEKTSQRPECTLLCTGTNEQGQALSQAIQSFGLISHFFQSSDDLSAAIAAQKLAIGDFVLVDMQTLASVAPEIWSASSTRFSLVFLNRSIDWYEDALMLQFDSTKVSELGQVRQVLSYQEEVFQNHQLKWLRRLAPKLNSLGRLGRALFQTLLELRIATIQKQVAKESYNVRKNLLTHDKGMQSMLSFSGKGLYE